MQENELQESARQLLTILKQVPSWDRFPEDISTWTPDQVRRRCPALQFWPEGMWDQLPDPIEETWFAFGRNAVAAWCPTWPCARGWFAAGAQTERKDAAAHLLGLQPSVRPPEAVLGSLEEAWRARLIARPEERPEVIVPNEWHERRVRVAEAKSQIATLAPNAIRCIERAGRESSSVVAILDDPYLHDDLLDKAIAALTNAAAPRRSLNQVIADHLARMTPEERLMAEARWREREALEQEKLAAQVHQIMRQGEEDDRFRESARAMMEQVATNRTFQDAVIRIADGLPRERPEQAAESPQIKSEPIEETNTLMTRGGDGQDNPFIGTSEAAVTAIVRAVQAVRTNNPNVTPNKKQIKIAAQRSHGAGDRALKRAIDLKLITPDLQITDQGAEFLRERS